MEKKILIMLSIMVVGIAFLACQKQKAKVDSDANAAANAVRYTCPMHPQIIKNEPGTCPVCGMALVQVSNANSHQLMLNDTQIRLANIQTRKVRKQLIGQTLMVNAKLAVDQSSSRVVSSRLEGRIERLYLKESGIPVKKGQPLYDLYSERLQTLEKEYLLALEQFELLGDKEKRFRNFLDAARKKLLLYGVAEHQIDELNRNRAMHESLTFYSPETGLVAEVLAGEGQYVTEGQPLFNFQKMESLWVEAELYPNETAMVKKGDKISILVEGVTRRTEVAKVTFLSPEFRNGSQITIMRATLSNPDLIYKPGMQAQVFFSSSEKQAVTVPSDAVIRDSKGAHLFVKSGQNTFEPRRVQLGIESFNDVEVVSGIAEGDEAVISGAYLLYSELVLKKGVDLSLHAHE